MMNCPTCNYPMDKAAKEDGLSLFWCPRCGTIKWDNIFGVACVPKCVEESTQATKSK